MSTPEMPTARVPTITSEQMRDVDRAMIEDYGIDLVQMMENAGRALAELARRRFLDGSAKGREVVALVGAGGNGGGALVAARRLIGWGANVRVVIATEEDGFGPVPAKQMAILRRMGIEPIRSDDFVSAADAPAPYLVIDGIIGYSLRGAPRGGAAELIRWAERAAVPVLSLDVPSGVDATSGEVHDPAMRAAATMTLALPKTGLTLPDARPHVGELYLADIGVPRGLYADVGLSDPGPLFEQSDIVRLIDQPPACAG